MDDVQTGNDTLSIKLGAGSSTFGDDVNPDYLKLLMLLNK